MRLQLSFFRNRTGEITGIALVTASPAILHRRDWLIQRHETVSALSRLVRYDPVNNLVNDLVKGQTA